MYRGAEPHLGVYETGEARLLGDLDHAAVDEKTRRTPVGGES
jgi:hypothetical protein